ncbi:glutathione s transferase d10 isoform a-related [Holotrichia oblita]|uniref:Glutathione s transferase d10 isoform a-related n=1 Tax=Holotrichia oblita TaxID=644536 RepID=A0ACB9TU79_HOLOL|nr:glutathione s transferase d10 isoform a-related [Holotrichia oblita]
MAPTLYSTDASPTCRAVLMISKALALPLNVEEINLQKREHFTPEYLKLNPQHTVPTLIDDGFVITNSHAISIYLTERYRKNHHLYPTDVIRRALVNQRMFFDEGTMYQILYLTMKYNIAKGEKIPEMSKNRAKDAYGFLEAFLEGQNWVAGSQQITIADLHLVATVTTLNVIFPFNANKYPNIKKWIDRCQALPYYEENVRGLRAYVRSVKPLLQN